MIFSSDSGVVPISGLFKNHGINQHFLRTQPSFFTPRAGGTLRGAAEERTHGGWLKRIARFLKQRVFYAATFDAKP